MMITMIMAGSVFAGTVSREKEVRFVTSYTDVYSGAVGNYVAAGDTLKARTSVQNTTNSDKYYEYSVRRYNWNIGSYDSEYISAITLANGVSYYADIYRDMTSYMYDYIHMVKGYASDKYSMATKVDDYTFLAKQYYRIE